MTSNPPTSECYVYITLPGETEPGNCQDSWRLSPAYDLTPATPVSLERRDLAMACGDEGRYASAKNILSQGTRFLLKADRAATIVDDMARYIRNNWYATARAAGVSERDCEQISGAFVYPGFHQ